MKKILIISKTFYPNTSPRANRTTQLAKELVRQGNDVTVMLPNLDVDYYKRYSVQTGVKFKSVGNQRFSNVVPVSLIQRISVRLLRMLIEFPDVELMNLVAKSLKNENDYDLLISIAVPHPIHWGVAKAIKVNKDLCKCWVADCGDPYMGCKTDTYKKLFYFKYIEKQWCKRCTFITIPEKTSISGYYPEFHEKIRVIPQGFDFDEIKLTDYSPNKIPTFAYAGGLAMHYRNPYPLLEYLCGIDQEFKFIVYNNTNILDPFKSRLKHKLEVRKYVAREELLPVLAQMDFLVNFDNNTSVQTPSKLIDYAIVNRPILSISKELNTKAVDEFLSKDYSRKMILPDLHQYDIKNVGKQFLNLIND